MDTDKRITVVWHGEAMARAMRNTDEHECLQ